MPRRYPSTAGKPPSVRHPSLFTKTRRATLTPQRNTSTPTSSSARDPSVRTDVDTVVRIPTNGIVRQGTLQTRYMEMLLGLDKVPRLHNILASFFGWLLLAGFVVFPGTFTSIQSLSTDPELAAEAPTAHAILNEVQNIPLLVVAAVACSIAALGLLWLAFRWRKNYVWLLNRIFLPTATNAVAGLVSTFITIYTQKNGDWSITAKVTGAVEAGTLVVCGTLFILSALMLQWVKRKHGKELERLESEQGGEGFLDNVGKKLNQAAMEPQSVV